MQLIDQVRSFILSNFYVANPETVFDDTSLLDSGIVDSTGVLEIISFIEATFGVTVDDSEMLPENLDSIDAIAGFVKRKTETVAA
ncbi:MAG TPA: acyl carrier protein [Burkholderiales bacterium]|nr:acyl carrier protein [Burkholderiales bacterium]